MEKTKIKEKKNLERAEEPLAGGRWTAGTEGEMQRKACFSAHRGRRGSTIIGTSADLKHKVRLSTRQNFEKSWRRDIKCQGTVRSAWACVPLPTAPKTSGPRLEVGDWALAAEDQEGCPTEGV